MSTISPVLACSSMHFSAGDVALIYSLLGGWLASIVLALVTPFVICFLHSSTSVKVTHFAIYAVYVGSGLVVFIRGLSRLQSEAWVIPIYGVPILAVSHFIALLWIRRQIRLRKATIE
jgi:hypothetical protein